MGISESHFFQLLAQGRIPPGFHLGRRRVWGYRELAAWVDAHCPPIAQWQHTWKDLQK
ncbi:MAG: helix-turn-helix transcriptional regulator [Phycisphaerae bacterium]